MMERRTIIQTRDLVKVYKTEAFRYKALDEVSLSIQEGEFVAIVGTSGSGKSTLLHLLAGLEKPTLGKVFVMDKPIHNMKEDQLVAFRLANMSVIFQSYHLMPSMTALENVAFPLMVKGVPRKLREKQARTMLERMGLVEYCQHYPKQLSGGQQQLVAVARALVRNPEVLLMDEPLSNVDPKWRAEMRELLRQINKDYHCTVLFVTHDIPEALYLGDHIMVFGETRIERIVTPEEFIQVYGNRNFIDFFGEL